MFKLPLPKKTVLLSMLGLTLALTGELVSAAPASDAIVTIPPEVKQWLDKNKAEVIILDVNGKLQSVDSNGKALKYEFKQRDQQVATLKAPKNSKTPVAPPSAPLTMFCWGSPLKCWP